jgi:hypothetical protein
MYQFYEEISFYKENLIINLINFHSELIKFLNLQHFYCLGFFISKRLSLIQNEILVFVPVIAFLKMEIYQIRLLHLAF